MDEGMSSNGAAGMLAGVGTVAMVIYFAVIVLMIAGLWKLFEKAGKPGWAAIVPIYNYIVALEIIGRPAWWIVLLILPCVNIVVLFIIMIDLAKSFGKETGYGIGMAVLPFIFLPMLGFSDAQYAGPSALPKEQV